MVWRNAAHQQTINQEVYDCKAAPHTSMKNQWVLEKSFDYLHKNTKLAAKYKGPFQIREFCRTIVLKLDYLREENLLFMQTN
jgi:hypothetical protein